MATDTTSKALDVSRKRKAGKARASAVHGRLVERMLVLRAKGKSQADIAHEIKRPVELVADEIGRARTAGDARALTDRAAAAVDAERKLRDAAKHARVLAQIEEAQTAEAAAAPADPSPAVAPAPPRRRFRIVYVCNPGSGPNPAMLAAHPELRARVVEKLEAGGASMLAALYRHCDTFYPSFDVPSDGLSLRHFVPEPRALGGGAGALCAAVGEV